MEIWTQNDLTHLLSKKHLGPVQDWKKNLKKITLELNDPIEVHSAWVYENIYRYPYKKISKRLHHGIQHVSRVAAYILIWANLYKDYLDPEALILSEEDIKYTQIAALFHDSAREAEGEDLWDRESALLLYYYLTETLQIKNIDKVKQSVEAAANKDVGIGTKNGGNTYYELKINDQNVPYWNETDKIPIKNIYQKLIHDSDCADIKRVRRFFDLHYLDFYQHIAKYNSEALKTTLLLVQEIQNLITLQGDQFNKNQWSLKEKYDCKEAYNYVIEDICASFHPTLKSLYQKQFIKE